jgi:hypothetical protein
VTGDTLSRCSTGATNSLIRHLNVPLGGGLAPRPGHPQARRRLPAPGRSLHLAVPTKPFPAAAEPYRDSVRHQGRASSRGLTHVGRLSRWLAAAPQSSLIKGQGNAAAR